MLQELYETGMLEAKRVRHLHIIHLKSLNCIGLV